MYISYKYDSPMLCDICIYILNIILYTYIIILYIYIYIYILLYKTHTYI